MGDILKKEMEEFVSDIKAQRASQIANLTEAMDDIQSDIVDELITEIETCGLIKHNSPLEVQLELENLREWLKMYYRLERR